MQDIRAAFRALKAAPIVSAVAVLSLALGIGANTAIFSILDSLVLRSLPVRDPHRLVQIYAGGTNRSSWTNPLWEEIRDRPDLFDGALAWGSPRFDLASGGETAFVNGLWVSGSFFDVLGVRTVLGRTLTPEDDRRGSPGGPVAVISYPFWQRQFNGAVDVIGKPLYLERVAFTVVGVTPIGFTGVDPGRAFDVAVPIGTEPLVRGRDSALDQRSFWWLGVMARLKPGQTTDAATAALRGVQPQIREATLPSNWRTENLPNYLKDGFTLLPAANGPISGVRRRYERPLVTIMIVVALVLLIACANIANLLLARAAARRHEFSVRLALGAARWRLARQLLAESLLLSGIGAVFALLLAQLGSRLLVRQISTQTNTVSVDVSLAWRVLGFTAAVTIGTAVLFGVAPALRGARVQPNEALKEQGRAIAGESRLAAGNLLVVAQVALSLVLVVAAGLFGRTFVTLATAHLGFDRDRVLVVDVNARRSSADPAQRNALYERLREAAGSVPRVEAAAASAVTPVSGNTWNTIIENPNGLALSEADRETYVNLVSPDWFRTYGTALIAGRDFDARDRQGAPAVVIVNETFARRFFSQRSPLGERIREVSRPGAEAPAMEIVGVVKDAVYASLRQPVPATMYQALAQDETPPSSISISVRAAGDAAIAPMALSRTVGEALSGVDRDLPLTFRSVAGDLSASLAQERIVAMLSGFFGALAVLLAGLGLYGITSYAVSRRRTEIGIRLALGAGPARAVALVLRRAAVLVASGIVVGTVVSLWIGHFVATLLFGLAPRDPVTILGAAAVLILAGCVAAWLPARHAARIDPAQVLREG